MKLENGTATQTDLTIPGRTENARTAGRALQVIEYPSLSFTAMTMFVKYHSGL